MIIVQRIITEWTKTSRGGNGAAARNATPDALQLPPLMSLASGYLLHEVRYREEENFAAISNATEAGAETHIRIDPLWLHVTKDQVDTRFNWSWHGCGAPERDSHDLFRLAIGEWGRFSCNGRFGAEAQSGRDWRYHKTVFNVAFVNNFDANLFLESASSADEASLAILK